MIHRISIIMFLLGCFSKLLIAEKAIIIMGPPGSGKGTQTHLLKKATGMPLIAPSTISRAERLKKTPVGRARLQFEDQPEVKNLLKFGLIFRYLSDLSENEKMRSALIFDSWPKHPDVVKLAKESILKDDKPLIIELMVEEKTLVSRAVERMVCTNSQCGKSFGLGEMPDDTGTCNVCKTELYKRENDNENSFPRRVKKYFRAREEFLNTYKVNGYNVHTINGDRNVNEVHTEIVNLVNEYIHPITKK